jgi:hypothetical protein
MAQERNITPEKQLLNLIEDPKANSSPMMRAYAIKHQALGIFSFGAWMGKISFFRHLFRKKMHGAGPIQLDVKLVNNLLGLCVFLLAAYFLSNLFNSIINSRKIPNLNFKPGEETASLNSDTGAITESRLSFYLDKVKQRDIFKKGESIAISDKPKPPTSKIIEATGHLRLVGISWSADPDAMVEDTNALRTFFVKRGQLIGEIKVEAIFKDKIVLSYGGEEVELR